MSQRRAAGAVQQPVMRGRLALVGVLTAPVLVVGAPLADAGETPTCFGEPATIVVSDLGADVVGTEGPDVIVVTDSEFWTTYGLGGSDRICTDGHAMGGSGHDRLLGLRRTAVVRELTLGGGPGDDRIYRRGPRDSDPHLSPLMRGGPGNDRLEGGANMDHILGGRGRDRIFGGAMWDGLRGGRGRDAIHGEGRGDRMYGGERADRLVGGPGRDVARGGPGVDTCDAEHELTC
jgi:Ca2+-binding RTX toxin-like protein